MLTGKYQVTTMKSIVLCNMVAQRSLCRPFDIARPKTQRTCAKMEYYLKSGGNNDVPFKPRKGAKVACTYPLIFRRDLYHKTHSNICFQLYRSKNQSK